MKHLVTILVILAFPLISFATEQEVDLLINGKDTVYLKTYPLEKLSLNTHPFGYTRATAPTSACWRGYKAVWRIIENKLYLEKIYRCDTDTQYGEENIFELFRNNDLKFEMKDSMILADWYTQDLYKMNFSIAKYYKDRLFLYEGWREEKKEDGVILRIEKGNITKTQIKL